MSVSTRFAHISDTHVMPDSIGPNQVFIDHLAQIRAADYDFVIHTGDLMDEPSDWSARAYKAIVSHLQIPVYTVPGNHDVYNPRMGDVEAPWWARLAVDSPLVQRYSDWFGPSWYALNQGQACFLALNSPIINSGLPEEREQWEWLEQTLQGMETERPHHLLLFTHMPLFVNHPYEELDQDDFRNRYLVIAPPGRDRLLDLIRRYRVTAVLTGHLHVHRQVSYSWPEGFTTQFVTAGTSGNPSPMAIDQFGLPLTPEQGLGYYEHRLDESGLTSMVHQHRSQAADGSWRLGPTWTTEVVDGGEPPQCEGREWHEPDYRPLAPDWSVVDTASPQPFVSNGGMAYYMRQAFDADGNGADMYLELLCERDVDVYLNGEPLYSLPALSHRPEVWWSADRSYCIDSPRLCLGLSPGLMRKGENVIAFRVSGSARTSGPEYVSYRSRNPSRQQEAAPAEG
jgi:hypothetical protein